MGSYEDNELFYDYNYRHEFMRLEFFEIYLSNVDRLLEESRAELMEAVKRAKTNERFAIEPTVDEGYWIDVSSELFYPSLFISLYADFEKSLVGLCDELPRPIEQLSVRDIGENSHIRKSQKYLVKVLNVDENFFGNHQVGWSRILNYGKLRNHLIHPNEASYIYIKNGKIEFVCKDNPDEVLSLHKKGGITWVTVNKGFCSDAINVIGNFWLSLFHELSKNFNIPLGYNRTYDGTITGR